MYVLKIIVVTSIKRSNLTYKRERAHATCHNSYSKTFNTFEVLKIQYLHIYKVELQFKFLLYKHLQGGYI